MSADASSKNGDRRHLWDDPKNVQILIWVFWACCAIVFALDFAFHRHPSFEGETLPIEEMVGFYSIYGFVACVLLVLVAKQMRKVLMRSEDYYGEVLGATAGEPDGGARDEGRAPDGESREGRDGGD